MNYLFIDVETSGFFKKSIPVRDPKQAWIMQIAATMLDKDLKKIWSFGEYIQSAGRTVHEKAFETHGITTDKCDAEGKPEKEVIDLLAAAITRTGNEKFTTVCHSIQFDTLMTCYYMNIYGHMLWALRIHEGPQFCTMKGTTEICRLPSKRGYKWPKLGELYEFCFNEVLEEAHDARVDVAATIRCFKHLKEKGLIDA